MPNLKDAKLNLVSSQPTASDDKPRVGDRPAGRPLWRRVFDVVKWRVVYAGSRRIQRLLGTKDVHWSRVVMNRETNRYLQSIDPSSKSAFEVSGSKWKDFGFASYRSAEYPEYDVCDGPLETQFDVVIAEQVLEHVLWPYRAIKNMHAMLKSGGILVVTTPFLVQVHEIPIDCSRWTETGLKYLMAECGFELSQVQTGSWGNRSCVETNFRKWVNWNVHLHSLKNDPIYPIVVWCFAKKT